MKVFVVSDVTFRSLFFFSVDGKGGGFLLNSFNGVSNTYIKIGLEDAKVYQFCLF